VSTSPSRRLISTQCPVCCHNSANWSENIFSGFCPSSRLSGRFHDGRTVYGVQSAMNSLPVGLFLFTTRVISHPWFKTVSQYSTPIVKSTRKTNKSLLTKGICSQINVISCWIVEKTTVIDRIYHYLQWDQILGRNTVWES
jgi:hypothetical protein